MITDLYIILCILYTTLTDGLSSICVALGVVMFFHHQFSWSGRDCPVFAYFLYDLAIFDRENPRAVATLEIVGIMFPAAKNIPQCAHTINAIPTIPLYLLRYTPPRHARCCLELFATLVLYIKCEFIPLDFFFSTR